MYDLTRSEFAAITKFGETSLSRWETGAVIQNLANDQLLYLLQFPENLQRLRERVAQGETHPVSGPISGRFSASLLRTSNNIGNEQVRFSFTRLSRRSPCIP